MILPIAASGANEARDIRLSPVRVGFEDRPHLQGRDDFRF
jgi:hypothetical protein